MLFPRVSKSTSRRRSLGSDSTEHLNRLANWKTMLSSNVECRILLTLTTALQILAELAISADWGKCLFTGTFLENVPLQTPSLLYLKQCDILGHTRLLVIKCLCSNCFTISRTCEASSHRDKFLHKYSGQIIPSTELKVILSITLEKWCKNDVSQLPVSRSAEQIEQIDM